MMPAPSLAPFQLLQYQLADAIRQQQADAAPADIRPGQFQVYQELFFNNVLNFVSSAFPVLCSLYSPVAWQQKVAAFFRGGAQPSPYFLHIASQFLQWQDGQPLAADEPPFLLELAHYEWMELELATRQVSAEVTLTALSTESALQLSALAELLIYQFPVMQISADFQPQQPDSSPHFLLLYRDLADEVKFIKLNQLSALLLFQIQTKPGIRWAELLAELCRLLPTQSSTMIVSNAGEFVQDLAKKAVIRAFQGA